MNKIAVTMRAYNRARFIGAAIESVLNQDFQDFELVVFDDGSTDETLSIIGRYAAMDGRVRAICSGVNRGSVWARKVAIEASSGEYIGGVDSDDLLLPGALRVTAAALDADATLGAVVTGHEKIDGRGQRIKTTLRQPPPAPCNPLTLSTMRPFHFGLFRRSVFEVAGGIDTTYPCTEDLDLYLRMAEYGGILHIPRPYYLYRQHQENISTRRRMEQSDCCVRALNAMLIRRGLTDRYTVQVHGSGLYFRLVARPS